MVKVVSCPNNHIFVKKKVVGALHKVLKMNYLVVDLTSDPLLFKFMSVLTRLKGEDEILHYSYSLSI